MVLRWLTMERWCARRSAAGMDGATDPAAVGVSALAPPITEGGAAWLALFARAAARTRCAAATRLAILAKPPPCDRTLTATGDADAGAGVAAGAVCAVSAEVVGTTAVLAAVEPANSGGCSSSVGRRSPRRVRPVLATSRARRHRTLTSAPAARRTPCCNTQEHTGTRAPRHDAPCCEICWGGQGVQVHQAPRGCGC